MSKSDRELGMHGGITRRDFIHDAGLAALGLSVPLGGFATPGTLAGNQATYPPARTGLRGSHPGSFEAAHAYARDGKPIPAPSDSGETYDLVVVGAGISGLAAAQFYRERFGHSARILLLDNHDDFGGHAKRNEFHQSGEMRLALGGTHNLEHWQFSDTVNSVIRKLGIDIPGMLRTQEFAYGRNGSRGPAVWFDADTYGENRLITNFSLDLGVAGQSLDRFDELPLSPEAITQLKSLYSKRVNVFAGDSDAAVEDYLTTTPYVDFMREYGGLGDEALQLYASASYGYWGLETRSLSAAEAMEMGLPGRNLLGYDATGEEADYPAALFPDGNASVARLQVHALIPAVAPGTTAANVAVAKFDYSQLDRPESTVRLRLNSTVVRAANTVTGVSVTYINSGRAYQVKAKHAVLACYHVIIPHLCPELPGEQKTALKYQVKRPLLLTNVLLRSSAALDSLGIVGAYCPGRMHAEVFMFKGLNTGGYTHPFSDDGPVPLTFWGSIAAPAEVHDLREQMRAARERMLALSFTDYEREVRTVLDGMLGPAGFDVKRDILAITVNRWPHGYSHDYMDLWDPACLPGQAPHEIARRPFGHITIANTDAGADAYTHVAIDQAYRAVQELS